MPLPPANDLAVVEVTIFSLDDEGIVPLHLAKTWLSEEENKRASSFRFDLHRERYIRGRAMMRTLLARRIGTSPGDLDLLLGNKGKPFLEDNSVSFNLSHSEGTAAFALGAVPDLGLDIERYERSVQVDGLARRCFREAEIQWLHSFPESERHCAFFRIWTAKEARMKATGEGFSLEPLRIEVSFEDGFPVRCLEPVFPPAYLASLSLPDAACSVVALAPFRVVEVAPPSLG